MSEEKIVSKVAMDDPSCPCGPTLAPPPQSERAPQELTARVIASRLSILDRLLTPAILVAMIIGVVIGEFAPNVQQTFDTARFKSVSAPIAVGLIVMMWPVLTKVQYEALHRLFKTRRIFYHILLSLVLNWILGPFIMLAVAWATLPDLPTYRTGVILVGLARCIAMVMVWNQLAGGDNNYCAVLVVINSVLQIVLYSPYALWFVNVISGAKPGSRIHVSYGDVAISVLIYLGIPLALGLLTRTIFMLTAPEFFHRRFLPWFSPITLLGLIYTIIVMFAYQGHHIIKNLGPVFRVFVPMILYFMIMWTVGFTTVWWLHKRQQRTGKVDDTWTYEMAVVQSFTAGSNNFELAIAVTIAVYGVGSDQALAATIGPLVEVPVLLSLTWVALFLKRKLKWGESLDGRDSQRETRSENNMSEVQVNGNS